MSWSYSVGIEPLYLEQIVVGSIDTKIIPSLKKAVGGETSLHSEKLSSDSALVIQVQAILQRVWL
jgi:hypothetical protein